MCIRDSNIVERMGRRFFDKPKSMDLPVSVQYNDGQLQAFVQRAMGSINCQPRNAYLDVSTGNAVIVPARDGRKASLDQVLSETKRELANGVRTVDVPLTKRTPPKVKDVAIGKFILVNQGAHTLSLYDRDKLLAQYPVCVGSPQWLSLIHISEPTRLGMISYAVFCLKKKKTHKQSDPYDYT